jgi:hypothetical protein
VALEAIRGQGNFPGKLRGVHEPTSHHATVSDLLASLRRSIFVREKTGCSPSTAHRLEAYATLIFQSVERCFQITYWEVRANQQPPRNGANVA